MRFQNLPAAYTGTTPVELGNGFSQPLQFTSASLSNAGLASMQAWGGTVAAVPFTATIYAGVTPSLDATPPTATANVASSGFRVSTNICTLNSTVSAIGKPTADIVFCVSTAHNANNRFFVGFNSSAALINSPLSGTGLGVRFGVGFEVGSSRLQFCGYDGANFMTPVDTNVDLGAVLIYRVRVALLPTGVFVGTLYGSSDFLRWSVLSSARWTPPGAFSTTSDVGVAFGNGASAGSGVIRVFGISVVRAMI